MLLWQCMLAVACGCCLLPGHEEKGEGVHSPRLISCGRGAPRVTALSWAPHP
ncbi:surface protease GP63, putative, partial [Trypanosoma cruzi]